MVTHLGEQGNLLNSQATLGHQLLYHLDVSLAKGATGRTSHQGDHSDCAVSAGDGNVKDGCLALVADLVAKHLLIREVLIRREHGFARDGAPAHVPHVDRAVVLDRRTVPLLVARTQNQFVAVVLQQRGEP